MSEEKEKRTKQDVEEVRELLSVVSKEVPSLIKGIVGSVFSEDAGRNMGKAAAAFYKELKDAGMPEETAVRMTENYVSVFTSLSDVLKGIGGKGTIKMSTEGDKEIGEEISKRIKEKLAEKHRGEKEEE